ncbi:hypothetical protein [uncultured Cetobacterium sp.]|uniref:hypothetical protein n=1 Tax=uncultured Cetobacterium sp. TaxID=527638 RepID=UPI00262CD268|nr:hypothetical protein [uncultured Cetobacterium sp.]
MNKLNMILEFICNVLKKHLILYYTIFIIGLLITIKNNKMNLEVILVSVIFLVISQLIVKIKR